MFLCYFIITFGSPAVTAVLIEILFGLVTLWVNPRNSVLDEGHDPPGEGAILRGKSGGPL